MRRKAREFVLGARPGDRPRPRDLLRAVQELGWGVLAERQDREIVMGAVTRPWEPDVTFHAIPPLLGVRLARGLAHPPTLPGPIEA